MTKSQIEPQWSYLRQVTGMTRLLVDQFPPDKVGFRPAPESRSAVEIVSHMYTFLADAVEMVGKGTFVGSEEPKLADKAAMLRWMDERATKAFAGFAALTDAQVAATIEAYGQKFTGGQLLGFAYDEHWHHGGQLTVYLRLCGIAPLMIYEYERLEK